MLRERIFSTRGVVISREHTPLSNTRYVHVELCEFPSTRIHALLEADKCSTAAARNLTFGNEYMISGVTALYSVNVDTATYHHGCFFADLHYFLSVPQGGPSHPLLMIPKIESFEFVKFVSRCGICSYSGKCRNVIDMYVAFT